MWFAVEMCVLAYTACIGGMFAFQRQLMYHPSKAISPPEMYGLVSVQDITLTSSDGIKLQAWANKARIGFPTIVYFHGNAANLSDRAAKFASFIAAGFGLLAVSYRGFGKSDGSPLESGIYNDARAAIDYALNILHVPHGKLIYFGESLGSGVAVQMATEHTPGLIVLEAAYTSVETRSAELYPFIPSARLFVLDKYDSLSKIKNVHAPLLMLHGQLDQVIPLAHGETLFNAANEPKQLIIYPDVHHADYALTQITVPLLATVQRYHLIEQ